ncbi:Sperm-associated antigen 16 protein [Merluccius polli]|uniref:Sperm-associated antigen 16 protein n=1 Tax=Merluccius polli TaxID=89951 RepID=A0AA47MEU3_MERPO|nr:Sperm-associated antigen 16 protein [Merluccius polli]
MTATTTTTTTTTTATTTTTDSFNFGDDNEDEFQYEVIVDEGDCGGVTEGEADFEATLNAVKEQSDGVGPPPPPPPEAVDDYIRNFLLRRGMTKTLDCFQTEWAEMLDAEPVPVLPDAYAQNHRLDRQLRHARLERDRYRSAASSAAETLSGLRRARDYHRAQHKRVLQERNRLAEDVRRLTVLCGRYEPAVRRITERYRTVLRQRTMAGLERDRLMEQVRRLQAAVHNMGPNEAGQSLNHHHDSGEAGRKTKSPVRKTTGDSKFPVGGGRRRGDVQWPTGVQGPPGVQGPTGVQGPLDPDSRGRPTEATADGFQLRSTIKAHGQPISCLASHPAKRTLATSSDDRRWRLWGLPGGDLVASGEGHTDWLSGVTFHPGETKLGTTGGDATVRVWDLAEGRLALSLRGHAGVTWGCSFHSCGDFVASCSIDFTVKVWDLQSERCRSTLRGHKGSVNSVEFLASGSNTLLSSSADKTLSLWDARTARCSQTVRGHTSPLNAATASSSSSSSSSSTTASSHAVASCDSCGVVMLWDTRNLVAPTAIVETGPRPSNQVAFDPRGKMLAVAGQDGSARVIDLATGQVAGVLRHGDAVQSVVFDHTGEYLLSGASDGQIYVWS